MAASLNRPNPGSGNLTNNPSAASDAAAGKMWGIYIGVVRSSQDIDRTGHLQVFIPELGKDPSSNSGVFSCEWVSPFAGATSPEVGSDPKKYKDTRKSYGMWMIPPDKDNIVLVCFADGNIKKPMVIGCQFAPYMNNMVPGMPGGKSFGDPLIKAPIAEKNSRDENTGQGSGVPRPMHADAAEWVVKQGLINDPIRGSGTSSARRESPSEVFGFLTPGPVDPTNSKHRLGGHQFIMDDGLASGNRHIRLRTSQGNQILLDDMLGTIYIINKKGNAWFEMDQTGHVQIYAEGGISMRTRGNFNLRADKNINIEAGNDIHIRAAGDNIGILSTYSYLGPNPMQAQGMQPLGTGGNIKLESAADFSLLATTNMTQTVLGGDYDLNTAGRIAMTSASPIPLKGGISLNTLGQIVLDSALETRIQSKTTIGIRAAGLATILAPLINLNTGALPPIVPVPAKAASLFTLSPVKDQAYEPPKFDRDKALLGETAIPNAGRRDGKQDNVQTIVPNFITAEPFSGHANVDPASEAPSMIGENPAARPSMPGATTPGATAPATVVQPNGRVLVGSGFADAAGNLISGALPTVPAVPLGR